MAKYGSYPLQQVEKGLYTKGGEYVIMNTGEDYIGLYHILPNEKIYSGDEPHNSAKQLQKKLYNVSEDVKLFNRLKNNTLSNYKSPIAMKPYPEKSDYEEGFYHRCFVQKRNNPINTIIEIDAEQYYKINTNNREGINGIIWRDIVIEWRIIGINADILNYNTLKDAEKEFPGILNHINNYSEYSM